MRPKLEDGERMVGYRFSQIATEESTWPVRRGADGTAVVEATAVAGPTYYHAHTKGGVAVCRGCGESSRVGRSDTLRRWAHSHRCESGQRFDEKRHPKELRT